MTEGFQDIIKEDIQDLLEEKGCFYCDKKVEYRTLGGFKTDYDNLLNLQDPICKKCWSEKNVEVEEDCFSLSEIFNASKGELTETIETSWPEAIPVSEGECIATDIPREAIMSQCDHTYKPAEDNLLRCQKCSKEVSIMGN